MDLGAIGLARIDERRALAAWSGISEPSDFRIGSLISAMGPREALVWAAKPFAEPTVEPVDSTPWRLVHERVHLRVEQLDLEDEIGRIEKLGGRVITSLDPEWPTRLFELGAGMPHALWLLGRFPRDDQAAVALVGARASTSYGNAVATDLSYDLAGRGVCVVSGGAYGIDAAAHRGALSGSSQVETSNRCPTLAVLCGGLANLYPAGNSSLFSQILEHGGGLMSEMPPSFRPARWRFLERNRIIACLSLMTVVVEAGVRSGAIATANRALDLGREVGAVPGPITSIASAGTNQLISEGAGLVSSVHDVYRAIGAATPQMGQQGSFFGGASEGREWASRALSRVDPTERRVWDALPRSGSATLEAVTTESGLSLSEVQHGLAGLQASRLAKRDATGRWSRSESA